MNFPEFADTEKYADDQIDFYLNISVVLIAEDRRMHLTDMVVQLAAAHQLAAEELIQAAAVNTDGRHELRSLRTSGSADPLSCANDMGSTVVEEGGFWHLTSYGSRFLQMAQIFIG